MVNKVQVPTIGGLRKKLNINAATSATTIAGLEGQTLTIAQLAALVGTSTAVSSGTSASGAGGSGSSGGASLVVGPGLSGGGPLLGNVHVNLVAPIPFFMFSDDSDGGGLIVPGPPGSNGVIGVNGIPGAAVYMAAEPGEDGWNAIPGNPGTPGINGVGSPGPAGPAIYLAADPGEDAIMIPGPAGSGSGGGASWSITDGTHTVSSVTSLTVSGGTVGGSAGAATLAVVGGANITIDTHPTSPTAWDDEFEYGTAFDTTGARRAGANAWTVVGPASSLVANGNIGFFAASGTPVILATQAVPSGSWKFVSKAFPIAGGLGPTFSVINSSNGNALIIFSYTGNNIYLQRGAYNLSTGAYTFSANQGNTGLQTDVWIYMSVRYDGTSIYAGFSYTGMPDSFSEFVSDPVASYLGAVNLIGFGSAGIPNAGSLNNNGYADWFRRYS